MRTKDINSSSLSQPHPPRAAQLWLVKPRTLVMSWDRQLQEQSLGTGFPVLGIFCLISEGVWCLMTSCPPLSALPQRWLCWTPSVNTSSWVVTKRFSQEKPLSLAQHIWICVGLQRNDKWYRNYRNRLILWIFSWCHHPLPKNSSCPSFSLCRLEETTRAGWTCGDS